MKLCADWKQCHRWISMHAMTAAGAIQGAWLAVPDDMKSRMPEHLVSGATISLMLLGIIGRLIAQPPKES